MSLLSILMLISRELMPFLKEALLEGMSFRVWLRSNWLTFACLLNAFLLIAMVAHLSDLVHQNRIREDQLRDNVTELVAPAHALMVKFKEQKEQIRTLEAENAELRLLAGEGADTIDQYVEWMQKCGVDIKHGTCRVPTSPARPAARPRQTPLPHIVLPDETEQERNGFMDRMRRLLGRDKKDEE
mgnify:CR=1 FL=1